MNLKLEAEISLKRLLPYVEKALQKEIAIDPQGWEQYRQRVAQHFETLFGPYFDLYHERYDFFYHLTDLLITLARSWFARPTGLRMLDSQREQKPQWFQSNQMLGGVIYVGLFAGDLEGVRAKIPYFKELGLTYLHPLSCHHPGLLFKLGYIFNAYM